MGVYQDGQTIKVGNRLLYFNFFLFMFKYYDVGRRYLLIKS